MPEQMVNELFSGMAQDLAQEYARSLDLDGLPMEERLEFVKDVLAQEGFDIEWEKKDECYHIREVSDALIFILGKTTQRFAGSIRPLSLQFSIYQQKKLNVS